MERSLKHNMRSTTDQLPSEARGTCGTCHRSWKPSVDTGDLYTARGFFLPPPKKKQPQESKVKTTWIPTPQKHLQRNSRTCWGIVNHHHPQIISLIRPYIPPWKGPMAIAIPISLGLSWPRILIIHLLGLQYPSAKPYGRTSISGPWEIALPETKTAPENWWLEDEFPLGKTHFEVLC